MYIPILRLIVQVGIQALQVSLRLVQLVRVHGTEVQLLMLTLVHHPIGIQLIRSQVLMRQILPLL